jgi:charged multivesicular body protein 6
MGGSSSKSKKAKAKKHATTPKDQATLDLKRQRDRLKRYTAQLDKVIARENEVARALMRAGDKRRALLALRKRKSQESMRDKAASQMFNIETLISTIDFATMQKRVFDALKAGNTVLERLNAETSLDDVEQLMSDTADAVAYQQQVDDALSGKLTADDDAAVAADLDALEALIADQAAAEAAAEVAPVAAIVDDVPALKDDALKLDGAESAPAAAAAADHAVATTDAATAEKASKKVAVLS